MESTDAHDQCPASDAVRAALLSKRAELVAKVSELGAHDPAETANLNFGKRIGDGTSYAIERMNGAFQARTLYETVREIDRALERLDARTYGVCASCGVPIPTARLQLVPWAELCVPCSVPRRRA